MIATPTRTNLHWPVDVYRRVIKGEISDTEADVITSVRLDAQQRAKGISIRFGQAPVDPLQGYGTWLDERGHR